MRRSLASASTKTAPRVCVAFSGGLDSTVLLHVLVHARVALSLSLSAIHVHHGLSANADAWARHCRAVCRQWQVPFRLRRVLVNRAPRTSLEEEARKVRYTSFASVRTDLIALAQHADDQAETVLLQLLRGAGPKGLAGMGATKHLPDGRGGNALLWRPLLDATRAELESYASRHQLGWIEDESNHDVRFRRNFLRAEVMPMLARGFPASITTLARSARHLAETAELTDALADLDLACARRATGLDVGTLKAMAPVRLKNLLRRWFDTQMLRQPSEARLAALLRAVGESSNDTRLAWAHEGRVVRRIKGVLMCQ